MSATEETQHPKLVTLVYRLSSFKVDSIELNETPNFSNLNQNLIFYNVSFDALIDSDQKSIDLIIFVRIFYDNKEFLGQIKTTTTYEVKNYDELQSHNSLENLNEAVLIKWLDISYSTTRGIVLEKTAGAFLFPLIDPVALIEARNRRVHKNNDNSDQLA